LKIDIQKSVEIEKTHRTELLEAMFEVPAKTKLSVSLTGNLNLEEKPWNIGLIVGPSGSGKTLLLENLFGKPRELTWNRRSVIDDFDDNLSMESISDVCASVGFNTIPSWLRPYSVLSNGERFRVGTARALLASVGDIILLDEFTSVVDRHVAQFASHAIQRYVRKTNRQLIVASCHYDIIDWLQPDWLLEPGNPCKFTWRSLQPRPSITVSVSRVKYETWDLFKDFHYMSQDLNKAARCYGLFVNSSNQDLAGTGTREGEVSFSRSTTPELTSTLSSETSYENARLGDTSRQREGFEAGDSVRNRDVQNAILQNIPRSFDSNRAGRVLPSPNPTYRIASMCGVLYRPHPRVSDIYGFTRMVTLPDFQGLGLAFVLACKVASAYKALGKRLHSYPNHPAWIRSYQRSKDWMQIKEAGSFSPKRGDSSTVRGFGGRRCAVFLYIGLAMKREEAEALINVKT
jgi:ABC-type lipoprotein export system ATPase subunit